MRPDYDLLFYRLVQIGNFHTLWKECCAGQVPKSETLKAAEIWLLGVWWKLPGSVSRLEKTVASKTFMQIFFLEAARISVGNKDSLNRSIEKMRRLHAPPLLEKWLFLEFFGRSRQYQKQADLYQNSTPAERRSLVVPVLTSLEHDKINPTPLLSILSKKGATSAPEQTLYSALLHASKEQDEAIKLLESLLATRSDVPYTSRLLARFYCDRGDCHAALIEYDRLAQIDCLDGGDLRQWLTLSLSLPSGWPYLPIRVKHAFKFIPNDFVFRGMIATYVVIWFWVESRPADAEEVLAAHIRFQRDKENYIGKIEVVYYNYINLLCRKYKQITKFYKATTSRILYVIGESHSLAPANLEFYWNNELVRAKANLVMGIKMFHLIDGRDCQQKYCFLQRLRSIPNNSELLLTVGEIDCRPLGGIFSAAKNSKEHPLKILEKTINSYCNFVNLHCGDRSKNLTLSGIPAPQYGLNTDFESLNDQEEFLQMIYEANSLLKINCERFGWGFLDVYRATRAEDGRSNKRWHIDDYHLSPEFFIEAANDYLRPAI